MDDNTRKAFRNILIFTGVKFAILYGISKAAQRAYQDAQK